MRARSGKWRSLQKGTATRTAAASPQPVLVGVPPAPFRFTGLRRDSPVSSYTRGGGNDRFRFANGRVSAMADNHDGATGVSCAVFAYRTQEQADDLTMSPAADHQEVGVPRGSHQGSGLYPAFDMMFWFASTSALL
jgi:hypothetical protein